MKTGLESLEVGAPDITYSGNEGPKSPQEDQRMMQEFQMQQMAGGENGTMMASMDDPFYRQDSKNELALEMFGKELRLLTPEELDLLDEEGERLMQKFSGGENNRVRELLLKEETKGLSEEEKEELRQLIKTISAQMPQGGLGDMPMDMEQDPRTMAAGGGIMGVDGRTGFQGGGKDAGAGSNFGSENFGGGGDNNREQYGASGQYTRAKDTSFTTADQDRNQRETIARNIAANKEIERQKEIDRINKSIKEAYKNPFNKAIDNFRQKNIKATIRRNKASNLKDLNVFGKRSTMPGFIGSLIDAYDIPDDVDDFDIDSIREIGSTLSKSPTGITATQANTLGDLRQDIQMGNKSNITQSEFEDYMNRNKIENIGGGGDGPPIILPPVMPMGGADLDPEELGTEFTSQFTRNALTDADKERISNIGGKSIFLADGGMARERAAFGGIMGDDGRRAYGLGSIFKKAARAIKKVAKSPIGKAVLAGAAIKFGPGLLAKDSSFAKFMLKDPSSGFSLGNLFGKGLTKGGAFAGITALSSLPLFMGQEEDDENLDSISGARDNTKMDIPGIRQYIAANKGRVDPNEYAFLQPNFYAADGGRIGLREGGIGNLRGALSKQMFGYDDDEDEIKLAFGGSAGMPPVTMMSEGQNIKSFNDDESMNMAQGPQNPMPMPMQRPMMDPRMMQQMMMAQRMNPQMGNRMMAAMGGRMGFAEGGDEGELLDMGGMEKDYRNDGGFVPMGEYERKDDVPARLSKNEFVFTADAVRNAGGGDIDKGAEIMENMMTNLENGGKVSQGSQGLDGAREMFQTQQRLGEVL